MKNVLFLLLLLPAFSFSQGCKYDVDTYDQFVKVHKLEKSVKVSGQYDGFLELTFCKYGTSFFFRLKAIEDNQFAIAKEDPIIFLINNHSAIKAYPNQIYSVDVNTLNGTITLNATYFFENNNDIEKLKKNKVKSIRIYHRDFYKKYRIKEKFADNLLNTLKCF